MAAVDDPGEDVGLPPNYAEVSIMALRPSARIKLSQHLDLKQDMITPDTELTPDYRGLAELVGFSNMEIGNFPLRGSPTQSLLDAWNFRPHSTIGKLWEHMVTLGRLDVLVDCRKSLFRDVKAHLEEEAQRQAEITPEQDPTVTASDDHGVDQFRYMVVDDVRHPDSPTYFDAFVCYIPEGNDIKFVKEAIQVLEKPPHSLKLCVPGRDDLPGASRYTIEARLIEKRCRRMVIIMSQNFDRSAAADFQLKFAHCLSPGARSKKLIPVLIEKNYVVPSILKHVTTCDFTKPELQEWIWPRLASAIRAPNDMTDTEEFSSQQALEVQDIKFEGTRDYSVQWSSSNSEIVDISSATDSQL